MLSCLLVKLLFSRIYLIRLRLRAAPSAAIRWMRAFGLESSPEVFFTLDAAEDQPRPD
jgi:hypothetical protein